MLKDTSPQYRDALIIALTIADLNDTDVTNDQIRAWNPHDLYEWLYAWGYTYMNKRWFLNETDLEYSADDADYALWSTQ